jgi:hypothetical protein
MKFDFMACPLSIYRDKVFVEPRDINEVLTGAVVEVFFTMRHYYLRDKKFNTFQGEIQQIKIVKPGGSIALESNGATLARDRGMSLNSRPRLGRIKRKGGPRKESDRMEANDR